MATITMKPIYLKLGVVISALLLSACQPEAASSKQAVVSSHVRATGELTAANSFKASPPSVSNMWQYNIKQLAPESSMLTEGAVVVAFDGQRLVDELNNKSIELKSAEQELANRLARLFRVPQLTVSFALNEKLWAIKYVAIVALVGLAGYSMDATRVAAEIEPFKTAITLKFERA